MRNNYVRYCVLFGFFALIFIFQRMFCAKCQQLISLLKLRSPANVSPVVWKFPSSSMVSVTSLFDGKWLDYCSKLLFGSIDERWHIRIMRTNRQIVSIRVFDFSMASLHKFHIFTLHCQLAALFHSEFQFRLFDVERNFEIKRIISNGMCFFSLVDYLKATYENEHCIGKRDLNIWFFVLLEANKKNEYIWCSTVCFLSQKKIENVEMFVNCGSYPITILQLIWLDWQRHSWNSVAFFFPFSQFCALQKLNYN